MGAKLLILGASGLLGQALMTACRNRGWQPVGANRSTGVDLAGDELEEKLTSLVDFHRPDMLINAAACTDLNLCERSPAIAWRLHALLPSLLAKLADQRSMRWLQVSTDHYFHGDGPVSHSEQDRVTLVNEYARSKFAGEQAALSSKTALAVRCNIVGKRGWHDQPSFAEWVFKNLSAGQEVFGYTNVWSSSLEVGQAASLMLDLLEARALGLVQIGSQMPCSKAEFMIRFAQAIGCDTQLVRPTPRPAAMLARADSMGLDPSRAERWLTTRMPSTDQVIERLSSTFMEIANVGFQAASPCRAEIHR